MTTRAWERSPLPGGEGPPFGVLVMIIFLGLPLGNFIVALYPHTYFSPILQEFYNSYYEDCIKSRCVGILKKYIIPIMTTYADNKKGFFDYEIIKKYSAGLELTGQEVKSVRMGRMNLRGAFIVARAGQALLVGADIPAYQPKNTSVDYDPRRERRLLLAKKEISELSRAEETKGLTVVPLSVYNK